MNEQHENRVKIIIIIMVILIITIIIILMFIIITITIIIIHNYDIIIIVIISIKLEEKKHGCTKVSFAKASSEELFPRGNLRETSIQACFLSPPFRYLNISIKGK